MSFFFQPVKHSESDVFRVEISDLDAVLPLSLAATLSRGPRLVLQQQQNNLKGILSINHNYKTDTCKTAEKTPRTASKVNYYSLQKVMFICFICLLSQSLEKLL